MLQPNATHSKPFSLIIVYHDQISSLHLNFLIDALNQQHNKQFNSFWIDQTHDPSKLYRSLSEQAQFSWYLFQTDYPVVAGVRCWELISAFAQLMEHPAMGKWFSYLHLECLPRPDFVGHLLDVLPEIENHYGPDTVYILHQLWCDLSVEELDAKHYWQQLELSDPKLWFKKVSYATYKQHMQLAYYEYRWEDDAFAMSSDFARRLQLFSAVKLPLYFQDVFDIFEWLLRTQKPYAEAIRWVRIQDAVIYHLLHPRPFKEYSREFLDSVKERPDLFGHLSLFDLAQTSAFYQEAKHLRQQSWTSAELNQMYNDVRWRERGTVSLWLQALDRAHGMR